MAHEPETTTRTGLSAQSVETGLNTLLQQGWRRLLRAAAHFEQHHQQDPEALHELRVSMRRLRSIYQAFAPAFAPDDPRPESLRALFRRTNGQRDREVALTLLSSLPVPLPWLERQWQAELHSATAAFSHLPQQIRQLSKLPDTAPHANQHPTLGLFAAQGLRKQDQRFRRQLMALLTQWQDEDIHRLRIRCKKLRYLLEPFARQHRPCARTVKPLKALQDAIGEYRDLQLLRATLKTLRKHENHPQRKKDLKQARRTLKRWQQQRKKALQQTLQSEAESLSRSLQRSIASLQG